MFANTPNNYASLISVNNIHVLPIESNRLISDADPRNTQVEPYFTTVVTSRATGTAHEYIVLKTAFGFVAPALRALVARSGMIEGLLDSSGL